MVIAKGGLPQTDVLSAGSDLVVSARVIVPGEARRGARVQVFDVAGDHAGTQVAEIGPEPGDARQKRRNDQDAQIMV